MGNVLKGTHSHLSDDFLFVGACVYVTFLESERSLQAKPTNMQKF